MNKSDVSVILLLQVSIFNPLSLEIPEREFGKQCRPGSYAAECGIWSGSTQFTLQELQEFL